jgi:DNA-binding response OmpR family regulator
MHRHASRYRVPLAHSGEILEKNPGFSDTKAMNQRILLIEDNPQVAKSVQFSLKPEGFHVEHVGTLAAASKFSPFTGFCLALVDIMLPDGSGLEFCTEIRAGNPALPIVVITARPDEESLVESLAVASDFVRKPFGKKEILARIQKSLARQVSHGREIEYAELKLKVSEKTASYRGKAIELRPKEFAILSVLALHGGETLPRERILQHVDKNDEMFERSLAAHLSRMRKAFKDAGVNDFEFAAVPGGGYALRKKA